MSARSPARDRSSDKEDVTVFVDSDNAGDKEKRRSTVGQAIIVNGATVKTACNLLACIGLSSAENEYYAISAGACSGLGMQGLLKDWGIESKAQIKSDSSAARSFASRRGVGKMKHIQTRYLWTQERVARRHISLHKVPTADNISDLLTKAQNKANIDKFMRELGQQYRSGRASTAKALIGQSKETKKIQKK